VVSFGNTYFLNCLTRPFFFLSPSPRPCPSGGLLMGWPRQDCVFLNKTSSFDGYPFFGTKTPFSTFFSQPPLAEHRRLSILWLEPFLFHNGNIPPSFPSFLPFGLRPPPPPPPLSGVDSRSQKTSSGAPAFLFHCPSTAPFSLLNTLCYSSKDFSVPRPQVCGTPPSLCRPSTYRLSAFLMPTDSNLPSFVCDPLIHW